MSDSEITGRIHSFQSLGAVDGPGLRFVIFMQGCPIRCMYCHNPDTWNRRGGTEYTAAEVVAKVLRYRTYFGEDGGVTVSGGEALLQAPFVAALFRALKAEGIRTCLDTSGILHSEAEFRDESPFASDNPVSRDTVFGDSGQSVLTELLAVTDLVICDIKFTNEEDYHAYAHGSLSSVLSFLALTQAYHVPLWVRHVVVPGFTDSEEEVRAMISIAVKQDNLRRIELLPFRKLCITKYESLGIPFPCADIPECDETTLRKLNHLIPADYR